MGAEKQTLAPVVFQDTVLRHIFKDSLEDSGRMKDHLPSAVLNPITNISLYQFSLLPCHILLVPNSGFLLNRFQKKNQTITTTTKKPYQPKGSAFRVRSFLTGVARAGIVVFNKDPTAGGERGGGNSWHVPAPQILRLSPVVAWGDVEAEGDGSVVW